MRSDPSVDVLNLYSPEFEDSVKAVNHPIKRRMLSIVVYLSALTIVMFGFDSWRETKISEYDRLIHQFHLETEAHAARTLSRFLVMRELPGYSTDKKAIVDKPRFIEAAKKSFEEVLVEANYILMIYDQFRPTEYQASYDKFFQAISELKQLRETFLNNDLEFAQRYSSLPLLIQSSSEELFAIHDAASFARSKEKEAFFESTWWVMVFLGVSMIATAGILVLREIKKIDAILRSEKRYAEIAEMEQRRLATVFDLSPAGILQIDLQGHVWLINEQARQILDIQTGMENEWIERFDEQDRKKINDVLRRRVFIETAERGVELDVSVKSRSDADTKWLYVKLVCLKNINNVPVGAIITLIDVTQQKTNRQLLENSEKRLIEAQRLAHIGSWELDLVSNKLVWSNEIFAIFEIDQNRFGASYEAFLDGIHPDDRGIVNEAYQNSLVTKRPYEIVHRLLMKDGRVKYVRERCETFYDDSGKALRSTGTVQDITAQRMTELAIERLAFYDTLTGLPNRSLLLDRLNRSLAAGKRQSTPFSVLFVDLDHFKSINDTLGHEVGDSFLCEVAKRLQVCVRDNDTASRYGGDEFILLLPNTRQSGAEKVAKKILESLGRPILIGDNELQATPSIGIAVFPEHGDSVDTLISHADHAMYEAKTKGRNGFRFYRAA